MTQFSTTTASFFRRSCKAALLFCMILFSAHQANAQCTWNGSYPWGALPVCGCNSFGATLSIPSTAYATFPCVIGVEYVVSTCGSLNSVSGPWDGQLTGFNGTTYISTGSNNTNNATYPGFYNDDNGADCATSTASIDWTATYTGTVNVLSEYYNCGSVWQSTSALLKYKQVSTVTNTTSNAAVCQGSTKSLTYTISSGTASPTWSIVGGTASISGTTLTATTAGTVTVRATLGVCTSDVPFTVNATSVAGSIIQSPTSGGTVCNGSNVTYTLSGQTGTFNYFQYSWNSVGGPYSGSWGTTNPYTWTSSQNGASVLYVIGTVTNGVCPSVNTAPVNVTVQSTVNNPGAISVPASICLGATATVSNVTAATTGTPASSGPTYYYYWQRTSAPAVAYTMYDGPSVSTSSTLPSAVTGTPGTYLIARNSQFGCTGQANNATTINIPLTVDNAHTASISGGTSPICSGASSGTLTATNSGGSGSAAYQWYNGAGAIGGATSSTYVPSNTATASYYCIITDASCGAATSNTITITVNPNPTVNAGSALAAICQGGTSAALGGAFGGGATSAIWSDGGAGGSFANNSGATPATTTYTPLSTYSGTVTLTLTTAGGSCGTTSASKPLTVNPNPTVNAGSATSAICQGGTSAALGGSYGGGATSAIWSDGGAGGSFTNNSGTTPATTTYTASAASAALVTLTLTTSGGSCGTVFASKTITVNPTPTVSAGAAVAAICQGHTSAALGGAFGGGATSAIWSATPGIGTFANNGGATPNTTTYTATAGSGTPVSLTLTTSGGACGTVSASKNIIVNPNPVPTLNFAGTTCTGGLVTYNTDAGFSPNYTWTISGTAGVDYTLVGGTGVSTSNTASLRWITSGSHTVTVNYINGTGCTASTPTSLTQSFNQAPTTATITDVIDQCTSGHTATVNIAGGTSPYSFSTTCGGSFTGITAGQMPYEVDPAGATSCNLYGVTDANNCPYSGSYTTLNYSFTPSLTTGGSQTCNIPASTTRMFFDASGNLMAKITSSTSLGSTAVIVTNDGSPQSTTTTLHPQHYLQRHYSITPASPPGGTATVYLYLTDAEATALVSASGGDLHTAPAYYGTFPAAASTNSAFAAGTAIMKYDGGAETPASHGTETVITGITATHNPTVDGYTYSGVWQLNFSSNFSGFYVYARNSTTGNPLPVELINFTATPIDNKYIQLSWSTATETDNSGFQIERSTDGSNYQELGWVDGHGTTATQNDYLYSDLTALPGVVYYYRLKQVDVDGHFAYSHIVSAELTGDKGFSLEAMYPNPANSQVSIGVISSINTTATVTMTDMLGRIVMKEDWPLSVGYNINEFDIRNVAQGTYLVSVHSEATKSTRQLIITR
jgi:hypothetical protein